MAGRQTEEELHAIYDQSYVDQYDPHAVQRMRRMLSFFDLSGDEVVADFGCGNGVLLDAETGISLSENPALRIASDVSLPLPIAVDAVDSETQAHYTASNGSR